MNSLQKFYTVAFELSFMREVIRANQCSEFNPDTGTIETVPMAKQDQAHTEIDRAQMWNPSDEEH